MPRGCSRERGNQFKIIPSLPAFDRRFRSCQSSRTHIAYRGHGHHTTLTEPAKAGSFSDFPPYLVFGPYLPPVAPGISKYEPAAINSWKDMPPSWQPGVLGEGRAGGQAAATPARGGKGAAGRVLGREASDAFPSAPPPASAPGCHPGWGRRDPRSRPSGAGGESGLREASGRSLSVCPRREAGESGRGTRRPIHARRRAAVDRGAAATAALPWAALSSRAAPAPVRGYPG